MSNKDIDQRIVEMRFDNKQFESETSKTMSTLDKLKEKLNFKGAEKGLDEIDKAGKNIDFSKLESSLDTIKEKFSALDVIGVTALANITNSAVNAGKKLVKSLTIDQVSAGFDKYAEKTTSVQTLVNSTGKSVEEIEGVLDKLMWFSDETSYGFNDMTKALATMTSSGGDIKDLMSLIMGVANATAYAGKGASEFQRVMQYSVNQAYTTGYMQVQDWKTIEGATVNSKALIEQLIKAGEELGKIQKGQVDISSFRGSLKDKWLDKEVMEKGFGYFASVSDAIYEGYLTGDFEVYSEGLEAVGDSFGEVAYRAAASAQEAKTFKEAIDATKDAVSSKWMTSFQMLFGAYDKAKELWTGLANWLYEVFAVAGDIRNDILGSALVSTFEDIFDAVNDVGEVAENVKGVMEDLDEIANRVIMGEFGVHWGDPERFKELTELGYNYYAVQNKVNEKLGVAFRYTEELTGSQEKNAEAQKKQQKVLADEIETLSRLTDKELLNLGYSKKQIDAIKQIKKEADRLGVSVSFFMEHIKDINGRWALIDGFKNIGDTILSIINAIREAWLDIFPTERTGKSIYNLIAAFHKLTQYIVLDEETVDKLVRTFKGLFAIVDIVTTIISGPFKIAYKLITAILDHFNISILDTTAFIGDLIVQFRDFIFNSDLLGKIIDTIVPAITNAFGKFKEFINTIKQSEFVQNILLNIKSGYEGIAAAVKGLFTSISSMDMGTFIKNVFGENGYNIIQGLIEGIQNGGSSIFETISNFANSLIEKFKEIFEIHSPSRVMMAIGGFIIGGLVLGLTNGFKGVFDNIEGFAGNMITTFTDIAKKLNLNKIFSLALGGVGIAAIGAMVKQLSAVSEVTRSLSWVMDGVHKGLKNVSKGVKKYLTGAALKLAAEAFEDLARSVAILAASLWLVAGIPDDALSRAAWTLGILTGVLGVIIIAIMLLAKSMKGMQSVNFSAIFGSLALLLLSFAASIMLLTLAFKQLGKSSDKEFAKGMLAIWAFTRMIRGLIVLGSIFGKEDMKSLALLMLSVGVCIKLMADSAKKLGKLKPEQFEQGIKGVIYFGIVIGALMFATKLASDKDMKSLALLMLSVAACIFIMTRSAKTLGKMKPGQYWKGLGAILAFGGIITGLIAASRLAGPGDLAKIGLMLLGIGGAIALMAISARILGEMKIGALFKGVGAVAALAAICFGLIFFIGKYSTADLIKVGGTLAAIGVAIGIMAISVLMLGLLDIGTLAKGVAAVFFLSVFLAGLIIATGFAKSCYKNLIVMAVVIAILAGSVAALSFLDPKKMQNAVGAMSILMLVFSIMVAATHFASSDALGALIVMTLVIAALAGVLILLSKLEVKNTIQNAIALGILMLALTVALFPLRALGKDFSDVLGGVVALTLLMVPLFMMVGILALMSNVKNSIESAVALGILAGILVLLLIPLAAIGSAVFEAIAGVIALVLLSTSLFIIIKLLEDMSAVKNAEKNSLILMRFASTMVVLLAALTVVGALALFAGAGIISLVGVIVLLFLLVGALAIMENLNNAQKNSDILINFITKLIGGLTLALERIAKVAVMALIGVVALAGLMVLLGAFATFAVAAGALNRTFPDLQEFLDEGLPILNKIAKGMGTFLGNFVSGFTDTVADSLPKLGKCLGDFMFNATPFIMGVRAIKSGSVEKTKELTKAIGLLTVADFKNSIASFLTGGSSFADLGKKLSDFMTNALPFFAGLLLVKPGSLSSVKDLAEAISIMTKNDIVDAITSKFTKTDAIAEFGKKMPELGKALTEFSNNTKGVDAKRVSDAAKVAKAVAEIAKTVPSSGGLKASILGDADIDKYAKALPDFGSGLLSFSKSVSGITSSDMESARQVASCVSEIIKDLPKEDGLLQVFTGKTNMDNYTENLPKLGEGLNKFSEATKDVNPETVEKAVEAAKHINELNDSLPKQDGVIQFFTGQTDLGEFGTNIETFGNGLKAFSDAIKDTDSDKVTVSAAAAQSLADMAVALPKNTNHVKTFGANLKAYSENVAECFTVLGDISPETATTVLNYFSLLNSYINNMDADKVSKVTGVVQTLSDLLNSKKTANTDALTSITNAAYTSAESTITALEQNVGTLEEKGEALGASVVKGFEKENFYNAGVNAVKAIANGLTTVYPQDVGTSSGRTIGEKVVSGVKSQYDNMVKAGKHLIDGLTIGLTNKDKLKEVEDASKELGKTAVDGELEGQESNSPSKATIRAGKYLGEGLIIGLKDISNKVYGEGQKLGKGTASSLSDILSETIGLFDSDIDVNPTITPILDISNIRDGANDIDKLLGNSQLSASVNSARSIEMKMMNTSQNNNDIIDAINGLKDSVSNSPRNNYNINGITYDDGSNISNAVNELIRAVKIDRRS